MNNNCQELFLCPVIPSSDVPELDLYMDQIITLIENGLSLDRRNPEDKLLTKTMINNYSKDKLLQPIKGKKYTKEHVLMMLMIYHLKPVMSMQDIKKFFEAFCGDLTDNESYSSENVRALYDKFTKIRLSTSDTLTDCIERADINDKTALFLTLTSLSTAAARAAQRLLDDEKKEI